MLSELGHVQLHQETSQFTRAGARRLHDGMTHIAITYPFPLGAANGAARMTREIAAHLGALGIKVTILAVSASPQTRFPRPVVEKALLGHEFDQGLAAAGVAVIRVPQHPVSWTLDGLPIRRHIRALARRERLDAVLSYYQESAFLPGFLRRHGIHFGFISTWQSYALALGEQKKRSLVGTAVRKVRNHVLIRSPHRRAEILFPTSEFTKTELVAVLGVDPARLRVCYLGVDPAFLAIPHTYRAAVRNLIFFGRFVQLKGVRDALAALGKLKTRGIVDWQFRMIGLGDRAWVQGLAAKFGIESQVEVLPAVGDNELRGAIAWADLALMPSHAESFGLSFAEAQASGIPVVAYRTGSVPEVVADGETGWLVPLKNVNALADALAAAIANPVETRRRGEAGRSRVARVFTWEKTAHTILAGLETIL
jgi:glycosyltransferase involved in cell wall biosynthesis